MTQIKLRRGTSGAWLSSNPVLADGEAGLETDTGKLKFGNGSFAWSALGYFMPEHTHDASDIITGEFASARIPLANGSDRGGISPGNFAKLQNIEHRAISTPLPTAAPSTYAYGHTYFSIDGQTGWPNAYGTVETLRVNSINPRGFQTLTRKESGALAGEQWVRVEYDGDTWSQWNLVRVDDVAKAVTFKNSWTNFNATSYANLKSARTTGDLVALSGMPKPGTLTDGIGIATVVPEHRPLRDAYGFCIARTSVPSNVACMVAIRGSGTANPGEVQVFGAPSTTTYLGFGMTYNLGG